MTKAELGIDQEGSTARTEAPASNLIPPDEIGWLIEYRSVGNAPTYWAGKKDFTYNHTEAVRFARKEDAERVMHSSGQMVFAVKNLYAVEHMWCPRSLATPETVKQPPNAHISHPELGT